MLLKIMFWGWLEGFTSTFTYTLVFLCLPEELCYTDLTQFPLKLKLIFFIEGGKSAQKRPYENLSRELRKGLAETAHMRNLQNPFCNYLDIRKIQVRFLFTQSACGPLEFLPTLYWVWYLVWTTFCSSVWSIYICGGFQVKSGWAVSYSQ